MIGMVVFDYAPGFAKAMGEIAGWMGEDRLVCREDILEGGVSAFPDALIKLFAGENTGKLMASRRGLTRDDRERDGAQRRRRRRAASTRRNSRKLRINSPPRD